VLLRSWAQLIEAFIADQVDVVHLLSPMTIWARYGAKVPGRVVAWNHVDGSALTVAPTVGSVKDLRGSTVAVPFWYSIHNVVVQALLRANGLTPVIRGTGTLAANEVRLVVMAPSDMPPALAAGRIGGYIVAEPFNAVAETLGIGKVLRFTGDVWKRHACCVVFMHERDLAGRPDWSQRVINAIVKAQLYTREHRAEVAALLSRDDAHRYTPQPVTVLDKVLAPPAGAAAIYEQDGAIRHVDWHEQRIDFQPFPYPGYTEELVRRLRETEIDADKSFLAALDPAFVARDLVDERFVQAAIAANGGMGAFGLADAFSRTEIFSA
jgi:NitT/TauT family transport system substrate-binding protein